MTDAHDHDGHAHDDHGHGGDPDPEIRISPIAKTMVALLVTTVVFAIAMIPLVNGFDEMNDSRVDADEVLLPARPSGPLLQPHPPSDMQKLREEEADILDHYGWTDQAGGVARVPLERAQALILQEGFGPVGAASEAPQE